MKEEKQSAESHGQAEKLFDPDYFKDMKVFKERGFILEDEEARFDCQNRLIGNEKYIRRFTMEKSFVYKEGGLVIGDNWCHYKQAYINPYDVLYIKKGGYVGTVSFNDLVIYAMHLESPADDDEKVFTMIFRSFKTGNFFVIKYIYSEFYLVNIMNVGEEYFRYYAYEHESCLEEMIHEKANKGELTLFNNSEYNMLRRGAKIDVVLNGHK